MISNRPVNNPEFRLGDKVVFRRHISRHAWSVPQVKGGRQLGGHPGTQRQDPSSPDEVVAAFASLPRLKEHTK